MKVAGVILAGGKAKRMGSANKALLVLGNTPLVVRVAHRLRPQVDVLGLNANRDLNLFLEVGIDAPIVNDGIGGSLGPLDGILGALLFAEGQGCSHALTVSVDTPFIPLDLAEKLASHTNSQVAIALSNGRLHGTCGLWPTTQIDKLTAFILSGKSLKLLHYLSENGCVEVPFEGDDPDPFFNINTPDDLAAATRWL